MFLFYRRPWLCFVICLYEGFAHDANHPHRPNSPECPNFECKAGKRPVPKAESEYKVFATDYCPNDGSQYEFQDGRTKFAKSLSQCCFMKDVCVGTCGIAFETCWKRYWKCAEHQCDVAVADSPNDGNFGSEKQSCLQIAGENGAARIWADRKPTTTKSLMFYHIDHKQTCDDFRETQRQACDCVPAGEFDRALKKRTEDFFRIHSLRDLNKKGEIKSKKTWAAWKGKRPDMFMELTLRFNASLEIQSQTAGRDEKETRGDYGDANAKTAEL